MSTQRRRHVACDRMMRRSCRAAVALIASATLLALGACAPKENDDNGDLPGAEAVITAFVDAARDGDYARALELSASPVHPACDWMTTNGPESMPGAVVSDVTESGSTATATVTYGNDVVQPFTLVRVGANWRVQIPDSFRITVDFASRVVANVTVTRTFVDTPCTLAVTDGSLELFAWPGNYTLSVSDPTGVLSFAENASALVFVDDSPGDLTIDAVTDLELQTLTLRAREAGTLQSAFAACVDAGFQSVECPADLIAPRGATLVSGPAGTYTQIARLWTDDDETWRFQTQSDTIVVSDAGAEQSLSFSYTGSLTTDRDGGLVVAIG